MNRRFVISLYSIIALLTLGGVLYYTSPTESAPIMEAPLSINASLAIEGLLPREEHSLASDTSVLDFLMSESEEHSIPIATKEYVGMGTLVEGIGELRNGTDSKYWMYYVNGTSAPVGADTYVVQEGDVIEWKYQVPPEL